MPIKQDVRYILESGKAVRPYAYAGGGCGNICTESIVRVFRARLAIAGSDYPQKRDLPKCAGNADNFRKREKQAVWGVPGGLFL